MVQGGIDGCVRGSTSENEGSGGYAPLSTGRMLGTEEDKMCFVCVNETFADMTGEYPGATERKRADRDAPFYDLTMPKDSGI